MTDGHGVYDGIGSMLLSCLMGRRGYAPPGSRSEPGDVHLMGPGRSEFAALSPVSEWVDATGSLGEETERVGFEPTVRLPAHTLSKRAP